MGGLLSEKMVNENNCRLFRLSAVAGLCMGTACRGRNLICFYEAAVVGRTAATGNEQE